MNTTGKRIMAIDYGTVRIGIAFSDERQILATPFRTLINKNGMLNEIRRIIEHSNVEKIIVGLPLKEDGSDSQMTKQVRAFAEKLSDSILLPVELYDERYTSLLAQDSMIESGRKKKDRRKKGELDKRAASILLQEYLDSEK
jgi:putative Holliday junction resolvase